MRLKMLFVLLGIVWFLSSPAGWASEWIVKKDLGDINGDGIKETAVENWTAGSSAYARVSILSGKKIVLGPITICGDTADGYKADGKTIAFWASDLRSTLYKFDPHFYDFFWFKWHPKKKKYVAEREGFTRDRYSYDEAKRQMPKLAATRLADKLVLSRSNTFASDALILAKRQYGRVSNPKEVGFRLSHWQPENGRIYILNRVPDQERTFNTVLVYFKRNGQVSFDTADL